MYHFKESMWYVSYNQITDIYNIPGTHVQHNYCTMILSFTGIVYKLEVTLLEYYALTCKTWIC